eukprot:jgi/Phyca11/21872/fgenesh1_pg.PHYCAscaffold_174_\
MGPLVSASASPAIAEFLYETAKNVPANKFHGNEVEKTLYEQWVNQAEAHRQTLHGTSDGTLGPAHLINFMGSGSDYTAFYQHLGIIQGSEKEYDLLYEILGSLEFILSFMAMLLSSFVFWKTSLAGLRTSKLLQGFNLVRVLKRTDTELALLDSGNGYGSFGSVAGRASLHEILVNDIYRTFQGDVPRDIKPYKVKKYRRK